MTKANPPGPAPRRGAPGSAPTIYTVGHSTRSIEELLGLLGTCRIKLLADVRTVPGSRRHPQFGQEPLRRSLERAHIRYAHIPDLGGLRRPQQHSPNGGWRSLSFRGYADYMQTTRFSEAIDALIRSSEQEGPVAIMCAEAVPWRCHRSLIADALTVRGVNVTHIMSESSLRRHTLTGFAKVEGERITYPPEGAAH